MATYYSAMLRQDREMIVLPAVIKLVYVLELQLVQCVRLVILSRLSSPILPSRRFSIVQRHFRNYSFLQRGYKQLVERLTTLLSLLCVMIVGFAMELSKKLVQYPKTLQMGMHLWEALKVKRLVTMNTSGRA